MDAMRRSLRKQSDCSDSMDSSGGRMEGSAGEG